MTDIQKSIDKLTDKISELEAQLHVANESLDSQADEINQLKENKVNYDGIQSWVTEEYGKQVKSMISESVKMTDNLAWTPKGKAMKKLYSQVKTLGQLLITFSANGYDDIKDVKSVKLTGKNSFDIALEDLQETEFYDGSDYPSFFGEAHSGDEDEFGEDYDAFIQFLKDHKDDKVVDIDVRDTKWDVEIVVTIQGWKGTLSLMTVSDMFESRINNKLRNIKEAKRSDIKDYLNGTSTKAEKNAIKLWNGVKTFGDFIACYHYFGEIENDVLTMSKFSDEDIDKAFDVLVDVDAADQVAKYLGVDIKDLRDTLDAHRSDVVTSYDFDGEFFSVQLKSVKGTLHLDGFVDDRTSPDVDESKLNESVKNYFIDTLAPKIQDWIVEEYSNTVDNFIKESQSELSESLAAKFEEKINEAKKEINTNVSEFLESQKKGQFEKFDTMLEKLSASNEAAKFEALNSLNEGREDYANVYAVKNMPLQYQPLWESLSTEKRADVVRSSRLYNFSKPGVLESFWANQFKTGNVQNALINESLRQTQPVNNRYAGLFARAKKMQLR